MIDFRLSDPEFVGFVPKNAAEAIIKFRRLQQKGLHPMQYPETLVALAKALPGAEVDKMNDWIVCPQGVPTGTECTVIAANTQVHEQILREQKITLASPSQARPELRSQTGREPDDEKVADPPSSPPPLLLCPSLADDDSRASSACVERLQEKVDVSRGGWAH